ncbi:hypothetical protein TWF703_008980 [Orbilia oligospora]|uniref:Uncharacterized protein n=1 Tax=Orbilia oligospora TaxID=2813651 RepID=A0A7C8JNM0_ORBOL|nr:hypothetical protein TWF703_008980 [Orbilia oligospora]
MESETRPKEPKAANMPGPEVTPVNVAASSAEAMSSAAAADTSEKQDILYFPLRYTRIRNYWGFPELAFDDINNDPQEVQVEYCESDPKVYDFFIRSTFIKPIVALYETAEREGHYMVCGVQRAGKANELLGQPRMDVETHAERRV